MTLERAIKRNPYDPERGNESAYCRYLRYNVDGWYSLDSKEVYKRWKLEKENNMIKDCKVYKCDICGAEEIVVDGLSPIDTVTFEIYNLKPCICKRCLKLAVDAFNAEKVKEKENNK